MGGGCIPSKIAKCLVIIGALNWGLVGAGHFFGGDWNLVHMILGMWPGVEYAVYVLVGLAAIAKIIGCRCHMCKMSAGEGGTCSHPSGCTCGDCPRCGAKG